ncbi:4-alpha-glucanotransferase [Paludisphaera borealis]|uniref:4-alpha-glucanotransferase n=1 Tax=Paludisphaera borealis TaxID=1387353 RepID=A0A1U7CWN8_9BACT|nr:4-alpha-glucanotransferase [Paludisphaera borealis]APW63362.1 retaining 4-alpha-glucanotransferase [Paludisphaera borealis]
MRYPRSSGVLLHPSSLPGMFGIGDLGPEAHKFVDFLAEAGQRWWQLLPLGPTGAGNSPYQSHSSFAGNSLLISPEAMVARGWLKPTDLPDDPEPATDEVDYLKVIELKNGLIGKAFARFSPSDAGFQKFVAEQDHWLHDFALFMAIKELRQGLPWFAWEPELVSRQPEALAAFSESAAEAIRFHQFVQYVFYTQWKDLRTACMRRHVKMIGDIPIFVAHDSADVWARPDLFYLDKEGKPTVVAGVPPDYFSETGQLWGNPLYRWDAHAEEGYAWWIHRLNALLNQVDLIRIDHFRGFAAYWEVPGGSETAIHGRWAPGPGAALFHALQEKFPELPFIAEDLGLITPDVETLRDEFHLPGMRVLQFGFAADPDCEKHLPHRYETNCVAYTGTHDNDTSIGWLTSAHVESTQSIEEIEEERGFALRYAGTHGREFNWDMIRLAFSSVAEIAVIPMQDVLGLDSRARMNVPGKSEGNWGWRITPGELTTRVTNRLADLTALYGRWNGVLPAAHDLHRRPARSLHSGVTPESTHTDESGSKAGLAGPAGSASVGASPRA